VRKTTRMNKTTNITDPLGSSTDEEEKTNEDFSTRNTVDIGASRLASIMSMLKMNLPRSLSELKKMHNQRCSNATDPSLGQEEGAAGETIDQQTAEQCLTDLERTFDSFTPLFFHLLPGTVLYESKTVFKIQSCCIYLDTAEFYTRGQVIS